MTARYTPPPELQRDIARLRSRSLQVGLAGLALCAVGFLVNRDQFFRSYLVAFMLWNGVAMGCLAISMLHHLTGGAWGLVIRRMLEAGSRTFPVTLLLFLPLLAGIQNLYVWARPDVVAADPILQEKAAYLNIPFFLVRAAVYFAVWIGVSFVLNKWSLTQDETQTEPWHLKMQHLSAGGLILYALTVTFSSIDWMMSIDPHWVSTIWGILFIGGQTVAAMSLMILLLVTFANDRPFPEILTRRHFHDLGKLLFAFIMLWAYFQISQYIIIWSANLPEEIPYYLRRTQGGWQYIGAALILLHFVVPFTLLLSKGNKQSYPMLRWITVLLLVMRLVDLYWTLGPSAHGSEPAALHVHWLDLAAPAGVGGIWMWAFFSQLSNRPLLPQHDPMLEEALQHGR